MFLGAHACADSALACADELLAQLARGGASAGATLGIVYLTQACDERIGEILSRLRAALPAVQWVGSLAHGVIGNGFERVDGVAMAALLTDIDPAHWQLFSDSRPIEGASARALVHADPRSGDVAEALRGLAARFDQDGCFGGVGVAASPRGGQIAGHLVGGGPSGVAFDDGVRLLTRVTQGCSPIGAEHVVSACSAHYIEAIDGEPALDVLLADLEVPAAIRASRDGEALLRALPAARLRGGLLVGLADARPRRAPGFAGFLVRNLVGIDPRHRVIAVAATPTRGERLVFCTRNRDAARADLIRVCTELREEVEAQRLTILAAHYVSCVARGAALFGASGAEIGIIEHNLGAPPLVGMFANGEFQGDHLYAYTGVLSLFVAPDD